MNDTTCRNVGETPENAARVVPSLPEQSMPCSTSSTAFARVAASFAVSSTQLLGVLGGGGVRRLLAVVAEPVAGIVVAQARPSTRA